jgi:Flp pilus assembly protein TadG
MKSPEQSCVETAPPSPNEKAAGCRAGQRGASVRRKRRSGGNALMEWMLVILPSMALICFFVDVTWALFTWATIQNAVREGCRYAITFQTQTGLGQDASIENTVVQWSMGLVNANQVTVAYYTESSPITLVSSETGSTFSTTCSPAPCGNVPNNIVQVSVQSYPLTWLFPFSGTLINPFISSSPASISSYSYDVLGGYPAGVNSVSQ